MPRPKLPKLPRASKPKSRTGCDTWIRRVKCDEQKPLCKRCGLAGRVCDGYSNRVLNPPATQRPKLVALRRIAPALSPFTVNSGTSFERQSFHAFRIATEAGVAVHVANVSSFWSTLAPMLTQHDDAIRHAIVALGAAYRLIKLVPQHSESATFSLPPNRKHDYQDLERLMLTHYNLALRKLQVHIASQTPISVLSAIICCLIFICLENLRGNHQSAIIHLRSGVAIIDRVFPVRELIIPSSTLSTRDKPVSPLLSNNDIRTIITDFCRLEISERLFSYDAPTTLVQRLANNRSHNIRSDLDNVLSLPHELSNLEHAHAIQLSFSNDVMSFDWEASKHRGDKDFWDTPAVKSQYNGLLEAAAAVNDKYKAFLKSTRAPKLGTRDYASCSLDMVQITSLRCLLRMMPFRSSDQDKRSLAPIIQEVVYYAELFHQQWKAVTKTLNTSLDFTIETGIIAPLYFVYWYTLDPVVRAKILYILIKYRVQEGPWEGPTIARLLKMVGNEEYDTGDYRELNRSGKSDNIVEPLVLLDELRLK